MHKRTLRDILDEVRPINIKYDTEQGREKLFKIIEKRLKPNEKKKKENGEVFTPIPLIEEIMDFFEEIQPRCFVDANYKRFDVAGEMGNFSSVEFLCFPEEIQSDTKSFQKRAKASGATEIETVNLFF